MKGGKMNGLRSQTTFLVVLFLGLFAMAARDATDPDLWWHLATGRFIVQHGAVPHTDPFSYTIAGKEWIAHEWLTDVLLYELHRAAEWTGLIIAFAIVIVAAFFLLYLRCGPNVYIAGVATLCGALATRPVWGVRPQVLSLLLTSLWLLILERSAHTPKILWWTLPLTVLWVNLHAGFALGLTLIALFLAGEWIERKIEKQQPSPRSRFLALILALDLLLVPLNPNTVKLYWYPIATLRSSAMQRYIAEWASPNFHRAEYWPFLLIVLALFAILSWLRGAIRPRDLLLLCVSLFAAFCSIRLIPLFVLIAVPLIARQIAKWQSPKWGVEKLAQSRPLIDLLRGPLPLPARMTVNGIILIAMVAFAAIHTADVIQHQGQREAKVFPERATAFLWTHPPAGPVFNGYDWGGYLIWKLYPAGRVFIDGRADVYGDQFLHDFADTYEFKENWHQTLDHWHIQTVLVPVDSALATGLRRAPGWTISFEDALAVILTRSPSRTSLADNATFHLVSPNCTLVHYSHRRYARNYTPHSHLQVIIVANISPVSVVRLTGTQIPAGRMPSSAWKRCSKRLTSSRRASYGVFAQIVA
jgi:hypothetical protein